MKKTFKAWVESHNPELEWDWNNPQKLKQQFMETIKISGDIDIRTIF